MKLTHPTKNLESCVLFIHLFIFRIITGLHTKACEVIKVSFMIHADF